MGGWFGKSEKKAQKRPTILSILAMGNSIVGKTALIKRFSTNKFEVAIMTVGAECNIVERKVKDKNGDEVNVKIKIWDSPGQERFESIVLSSLKNSQGIFLVFDITSRPSFDDLKKWITKVEQAQDPKTFPFIIIANKIDLKEKSEVSSEEAQAFANKYNLPLFETSAKSGQGVEEAFQTLIQKVYDNNKGKKNNNFEIQ